ncbi:DUF1131 family protein [Breoghania sp. L-A4]|uniref:DUF1131 family protein n=1 Tax=Breoghania sp. L-A4 TaxID=2304600 RepID=UPI0019683771|nr:DUF1131 family protein [Breoghania sp. L-A4]
MQMNLVCAAFMALLTAGCVTSSDTGSSSSAMPDQSLLRITAQSAGTLTAETPYSTKAIEAVHEGFTTQPIQIAVEDHTLWTIGAFYEGFQMLQVIKGKDGKIGQVHGVSPHLTGPNGERIGMSFAQVGMARGDCRVGTNLWRGMAVCPARGADNITLVFAIPGYAGPFDQMPPPSSLPTRRCSGSSGRRRARAFPC